MTIKWDAVNVLTIAAVNRNLYIYELFDISRAECLMNKRHDNIYRSIFSG